jgi:hypothetical protein
VFAKRTLAESGKKLAPDAKYPINTPLRLGALLPLRGPAAAKLGIDAGAPPAKRADVGMRIQSPALAHLISMHGKGLTRLVVAIATFVLGAGVTLGAMGLPILMALQR